jgi:hypothetical protein
MIWPDRSGGSRASTGSGKTMKRCGSGCRNSLRPSSRGVRIDPGELQGGAGSDTLLSGGGRGRSHRPGNARAAGPPRRALWGHCLRHCSPGGRQRHRVAVRRWSGCRSGRQAAHDHAGPDPGIARRRSLLPPAGADLAEDRGDGTSSRLTLSPPVIALDLERG